MIARLSAPPTSLYILEEVGGALVESRTAFDGLDALGASAKTELVSSKCAVTSQNDYFVHDMDIRQVSEAYELLMESISRDIGQRLSKFREGDARVIDIEDFGEHRPGRFFE